MTRHPLTVVEPGSFEPEHHFYTRVLNAQLHPLVRAFLALGNDRIAERFIHLHPEVKPDAIRETLAHVPHHFRWGGADLLHVTTQQGHRRVVVIETNSCPSGQKSMPIVDETREKAGYEILLERAFLPALRKRSLPQGGLAVLFDKNLMEASGYAATMADLTGERVFLTPFHHDDPDPSARFDDGLLHVRDEQGVWHPIRACLRYVTQRPWSRIPPVTRTLVFNPVLVCLAGGRNKMLAAKAYEFLNGDLASTGLRIRVPETLWDVAKEEVPIWVRRMGGFAVVKVPYSNAGQGVYTITGEQELAAFMAEEHRYDRFIVQGLIGNSGWSSRSSAGRFYHVGTIPNRKGEIHVADLRFMVGGGPDGFFPVALYARRARKPLVEKLEAGVASWDMLGTNLSVKKDDGSWDSESQRLLLMDARDFNRLGIGIDDLIEAYVQTVLAVTAIDAMAVRLLTQKGRFRRRFFRTLNPDDALIEEIVP